MTVCLEGRCSIQLSYATNIFLFQLSSTFVTVPPGAGCSIQLSYATLRCGAKLPARPSEAERKRKLRDLALRSEAARPSVPAKGEGRRKLRDLALRSEAARPSVPARGEGRRKLRDLALRSEAACPSVPAEGEGRRKLRDLIQLFGFHYFIHCCPDNYQGKVERDLLVCGCKYTIKQLYFTRLYSF